MLEGGEKVSRTESVLESKKTPELFSATLGFDFVFSKDKEGKLHCYCIEINGHNSAIKGVQDVPEGQINNTQRMVASIRGAENPELHRKYVIGQEIFDKLGAGEFSASEEGKKRIKDFVDRSIEEEPMFVHAHKNPDFIENLTRDKALQDRYVPEENRPRVWHEGEDSVSSSGAWVVKDRGSTGGSGVIVIPNSRFSEFVSVDRELRDKFIAQEMVMSAGAQMEPESEGKRAASMRLLMDFKYLKDGTIVPETVFAYQRVSPFGLIEINDRGPEIHTKILNAAYVVNRARGALSVASSPLESTMAREVAEKIIKNIAKDYLEHLE